MFGRNKKQDNEDNTDVTGNLSEPAKMTWSIQRVRGFVKNINPNFIRARRERARAEALRESNNTNVFKWVTLLSMIVLVAIIGYIMLQQGGFGGIAGGVSQASEAVTGTQMG